MKHCIILLGVCLLLTAGCNKKTASQATQPGASPGGDGPVPVAGKGDGDSGRNAVLQVPFDNAAKLVMLNIGRAYQMASITNNKAPKNAGELDAGKMKTLRDMQEREVEVAYGVDVKRLDDASSYALAWEKTPTNDGCRLVLMADFTTVKYVTQAEFDRMKKAK